MKWEIECLRILTVREETATRVCPSKRMDRTKIEFRGNRPVGQREQDGTAGSGIYQEGRTGLARNHKQKNIRRQRRLSTSVRIKHKSRRRICGLDGGLSKM
jgi:hypothetical protein